MTEPTSSEAQERPAAKERPDRPPVAQGPQMPRYETITPHAPFAPGAGIRLGAMPVGPPGSPNGAPGSWVPATWAQDPSERHELRWWSGIAWTEWVADDGVEGQDPLDPA
ncbi:hypothetical protein [Aquihabitans sp. McL0605]|uniref:hypothetical protein n=1 Tax=Aquihabitans sp. McL0605 TaxID=3415671 RepID=UPI003CF779AD